MNLPVDFSLPERARKFAIDAHAGQRHGPRPFFTHPALAASFVKRWRFGPEFVAAAWLHDTIEDTDTTLAVIMREFGPGVALMVDAVTCVGETHAQRLADTYAKIRKHPNAAIVRLGDRCANLTHCVPGDRWATRYLAEAPGFEDVIRPRVPPIPWREYRGLLDRLKTEPEAIDGPVNRA